MGTTDLIQWSDQFSVNIQEIDEQHKVLVDLLNQLHNAIHEHHGRATSREILNRLAEYTRTHFLLESLGSLDASLRERGNRLHIRRGDAAETVAASARHRGAVLGEPDPVARVVDLGTIVDVLRGKLEFESGEEGREQAVLEHLLRRATADTASRALGGVDVGPLVAAIEDGSPVTTGERVSAKNVLAALPGLPVLDTLAERLDAHSDGQRAAAVELALEGLYLAKRIDKTSDEGETVYG